MEFSRIFSLHKFIIILFGLFPILPNRIKGLPVILLALVSLYDYFKTRSKKNKNWKFLLIMSSTYLFYLLSALYSENRDVVARKLEIGLSLIIIPLFFYLSFEKWNKKSYYTLLYKTYLYSLSSYSIIYFAFSFFYENESYPKGFFITSFMRKAIIELPYIDTHPIYASIFFGIGIIITFHLYKKLNKISSSIFLLLFSLSIIVLASKMVMISLVIISLITMVRKINSKRIILLATLSTVFLSIILYLFVPSINSRFKELFKKNTYEKVDINNSSSIRFAINECSTSLILKAGFLGLGIGDVQDELNSCYNDESEYLLTKQYNTHNQYLGIWLGTGLFGLMAFLLMLGYNFRLAWINNDTLFMSILLFFSINFLTENLLERQSGIIMFAFLINFFGWQYYKRIN